MDSHAPNDSAPATSVDTHALSVDVEDYFQAPGCSTRAPRHRWGDYPLRVEDNVHRLLDMFDEHAARATFFVPGWTAHTCPHLVTEIAERGHELGSRGYWLKTVDEFAPDAFAAELRETTRLIEDAAGAPVRGFRAPQASIVESTLWAFDVLEELGYTFDSSVRPYAHERYGYPGFPRRPVVVSRRERGGGIVEVPFSSLRLFGMTLPGPSGGFFRLFPAGYCGWALSRAAKCDGWPGVVSLAAWEIDPDQPRLTSTVAESFRQYAGLRGVESKLGRLLGKFRFAPIGAVLEHSPPGAAFTLKSASQRLSGVAAVAT